MQVRPAGQAGYPISLVASLDTVPVKCCVPLQAKPIEVLHLFRCSTHTILSQFVTHTQIVTYNFVTNTHNFVTYKLSHTTLSHTTLSHATLSRTHTHTTLSHTQLCHTPSLSHTTLSHTIFHTHPCHPPTLCVSGVALGGTYLRFTWRAWRLATCTVVLRGSRGTYGTGLALVARLGAVAPHHFSVAGAALGGIYLRFTWQAWHLATSSLRRFTWQAWCLATLTLVSRARCGNYGTVWWRAWAPWRRGSFA